jgi:CheY-like chemotaxis protein
MPVRHVLVVDDSKSARLMLRKMLQGFGLTVDTVESGEEALNYLRGQRPDAIFMDHTMPGMDGLTAVRRICADPDTARIPVAMYTSKDEPTYRSEARAAGALDVLTKPAMPEVLGTMIERMGALIDAPPPVETLPPASEPEPPTSDSPVSAEWVGRIALEKAEIVFYESIESQVLPLINDVVAKLRRELESSQEGVATRVCQARLAAWQPPRDADATQPVAAMFAQVQPLLDQRLAAFQRESQPEIEQRLRVMAAEICQTQLHELSERLVRQLSQRFTETTQKVVITAREAAQQAARETAQEITLHTITEAGPPGAGSSDDSGVGAGRIAIAAAEQTARRVWEEAQGDLRRRINRAAGWSVLVGAGAAALAVYGLLR